MEKKALIISNSAGLVTSFLKNDVELLIERGYTIACACNTRYTDSNTNNFFCQYKIDVFDVDFPIRTLDFNKITNSYNKIKNILRSNAYSVIHCHSTIAAIIGRECAKKYRKKGTKVCYTSHGLPFYKGNEGLKSKIFYIIEKHYSRYTDLIFSICNEDFERLKKMHCKQVYLMHGVGIDVSRFEDCHIDRKKYREELGIEENKIMILSIGEINANKNHQIIIRALSKLSIPNIVYAICGRELTEKGKKDELIELANTLNVKLVMLGFRKDIPQICKCADMGALPSFKEGLGLSGVEMLASGLPIVGSNRQGIKDYIQNDETGYLADPTQVDSFASAIEKCLFLIKEEGTKEKCISMSKRFSLEHAKNILDKGYMKIDI